MFDKIIESALSQCGLLVACLLIAIWQLWRAKEKESAHLRQTNEKLYEILRRGNEAGD